jgi:hypothetical protein
MNSLRRVVLIALFLTFAPAYAQTPVTLDQIIPVDKQKELGLDTLSAEQRAAIAKLLQEIYLVGVQNGKEATPPPKPAAAAPVTPATIESKIEGSFEGWEGETIVKLLNGQIWQQSEYYYHYHYAFMPDVLVYNSGGGYKMKVQGVDRAVGVTRLR